MADAERASSLAFCRDTITRIADKGHLQRAHIETLLSERVRIFGTQDIRCTKKVSYLSERSELLFTNVWARRVCALNMTITKTRFARNVMKSDFFVRFQNTVIPFGFILFFFFKTLGFLPPIFQTFRPQKYGQVKARRMDRSAQGEHEVSVKWLEEQMAMMKFLQCGLVKPAK